MAEILSGRAKTELVLIYTYICFAHGKDHAYRKTIVNEIVQNAINLMHRYIVFIWLILLLEQLPSLRADKVSKLLSHLSQFS
jgi:hypothetical protein